MSGSLNGSAPQRRTRPSLESLGAEVHSLADWREQHQTDCVAGAKAVSDRLGHLEATVNNIAGKVDLLVSAFIREKEHPDGSTTVGWRVPWPSGKTWLAIAGAFGGIVVILQLTLVMAVPAIKAGLDWVMAYGH